MSEPGDILWKNMSGNQGLFIVRRFLTFAFGLMIIYFVSSPTVVYSELKTYDKEGFLQFNWVDNSASRNFLKIHLPPLIIVLINVVLFMLIYYMSYFECYETHSSFQRAIFTKATVYLGLNMILIPSLQLSQEFNGSLKEWFSI